MIDEFLGPFVGLQIVRRMASSSHKFDNQVLRFEILSDIDFAVVITASSEN